MKRLRLALLATLFGAAIGIASAQPGGGPGPGKGPGAGMGPGGAGPAASAPGRGMGRGRAGGRAGADYTPGWTLMTSQERAEHRARMRSMTSYDECKAYQEQTHEQMAARAKERGGKPLAQPRRDACLGLKK